jgi:hypothetical protein
MVLTLFSSAPKAKRVILFLAYTSLTKFEEKVFKPVLESFAAFKQDPNYAKLSLSYSKL